MKKLLYVIVFVFIILGRQIYSSQKSINQLSNFDKASTLRFLESEWDYTWVIEKVEEYKINNDKSYYLKWLEKWMNKNYEWALIDFNKAIRINPNNDSYYYWRSRAKWSLSDYTWAIEDINSAININWNNSDYYYERWMLNSIIENYSLAIIDVNKAISMNTENKDYIKLKIIIEDNLNK